MQLQLILPLVHLGADLAGLHNSRHTRTSLGPSRGCYFLPARQAGGRGERACARQRQRSTAARSAQRYRSCLLLWLVPRPLPLTLDPLPEGLQCVAPCTCVHSNGCAYYTLYASYTRPREELATGQPRS